MVGGDDVAAILILTQGPRRNMEALYSSGDLQSASKAKKPPTIDIPMEPQPVNHAQTHEPEKVPISAPLPLTPNAKNCLCSPTTHAGSFRCRLHRSLQKQWSMGSSSNNGRLPSSSPPREAPPDTVDGASLGTIPNTVEAQ
ncbi:hypothetical protein SUGI_0092060 [Cryptomeria japonica]|nr:hypothetical protein SUGI_0092060 [Cryptomeria japonica]